jgi:transposase
LTAPDFERFARTPCPIASRASSGINRLSSALAFSCLRLPVQSAAAAARRRTGEGAPIAARKMCDLCCNRLVPPTRDSLPDDVDALKAMVIATQLACLEAEAKARNAEAEVRVRELMIEQMKFTIAKLRHERYGQSSERSTVLEQLELSLANMEEDASQAEAAAATAANAAANAKITVKAFERRKPARRPLPEHLPRERVVYPSPSACPCCGGVLHKLGEDVTETLELIPRQWKVIQHVARSSRAAPAKQSPSRRRRRTRSRAAAPDRSSWRTSCSPSMACICRSTARAPSMPAKASISTSQCADWVGAAAAP